MTVLKTELMRT